MLTCYSVTIAMDSVSNFVSAHPIAMIGALGIMALLLIIVYFWDFKWSSSAKTSEETKLDELIDEVEKKQT